MFLACCCRFLRWQVDGRALTLALAIGFLVLVLLHSMLIKTQLSKPSYWLSIRVHDYLLNVTVNAHFLIDIGSAKAYTMPIHRRIPSCDLDKHNSQGQGHWIVIVNSLLLTVNVMCRSLSDRNRTGRAGGSWRHMRELRGARGQCVMFIEGKHAIIHPFYKDISYRRQSDVCEAWRCF